MAGVGRILEAVVIIFIVAGALATLDGTFGTAAQATSLNNTNAQSYNTFNNSVYNPLRSSVATAVGTTNGNFSSASAANGFGWAFIINGFGNMYTQLTQAPAFLVADLGQFINGLGLSNFGISTTTITGLIGVLFGIFLAVVAIELWMKTSVW